MVDGEANLASGEDPDEGDFCPDCGFGSIQGTFDDFEAEEWSGDR